MKYKTISIKLIIHTFELFGLHFPFLGDSDDSVVFVGVIEEKNAIASHNGN